MDDINQINTGSKMNRNDAGKQNMKLIEIKLNKKK